MVHAFVGMVFFVTVKGLSVGRLLPVLYPAAIFVPSARSLHIFFLAVRESGVPMWVMIVIIADKTTILIVFGMLVLRSILPCPSWFFSHRFLWTLWTWTLRTWTLRTWTLRTLSFWPWTFWSWTLWPRTFWC